MSSINKRYNLMTNIWQTFNFQLLTIQIIKHTKFIRSDIYHLHIWRNSILRQSNICYYRI